MALETLRRRGVTVPAILVVDAEIVLPRASLSLSGALDVLEKPVNKRALLGWIECVIAAHIAIAKARAEFRPAA
ncbi:MAG TPA: hypothetical protein VMF58_13505 [Rhizomicrobium sp.]|nr:hypothetical protein [Rhizomicrobium sp.]